MTSNACLVHRKICINYRYYYTHVRCRRLNCRIPSHTAVTSYIQPSYIDMECVQLGPLRFPPSRVQRPSMVNIGSRLTADLEWIRCTVHGRDRTPMLWVEDQTDARSFCCMVMHSHLLINHKPFIFAAHPVHPNVLIPWMLTGARG